MRLIRELLLENWGLKLTAVFLAFFLWLVVRGDPSAERVISVSLEFRVPRNVEITSERPTTVDVTVRGAFTNLWFSPSIPTYVIDLQPYDEGEHVILLAPQHVRFPRASGLEAIAVRPARLKIRLERTASKEVPIRVVTLGEPGAGIDVYGVTVKPPTALVSGPRSSIERMHEIVTETVALAGQRQSMRKLLNLDIRDDAVHSTPVGPVEVNVQLGPHRRLLKVQKIPVVVEEGVTANPRWISVQALVPISYDKVPGPAEFIATVPLLEPNQAAAKVKPVVRLKEPMNSDIVIKEILPAEVVLQKKPR